MPKDDLRPLASFDVTDFTPPWVTAVVDELRTENERLRSALQDIDNDFGAGNPGGLSDFIHAVLKLGA